MTLTDKDKELIVRLRLLGIRKDWCAYFAWPHCGNTVSLADRLEAFESGRHRADYFCSEECYLLPAGITAEFDEAMK